MIEFFKSISTVDAITIILAVGGLIATYLYALSCLWLKLGKTRKQRAVRLMVKICDKLDGINKVIKDYSNDDEPYDPTWMDRKKWEATRI